MECIDLWFQENRCCPICKQDVSGVVGNNHPRESVEIELTNLNTATTSSTITSNSE